MPDNPELIEQYESELWQIIYKMHKDGIPYETAHYILQEMTKSLDLMAYSEKWLEQYTPVIKG